MYGLTLRLPARLAEQSRAKCSTFLMKDLHVWWGITIMLRDFH
ncbi:MAG: hypothetical protein ACI97B_000589 [Verrucomicrobiales bacterium]|jgi:hypothetical protein